MIIKNNSLDKTSESEVVSDFEILAQKWSKINAREKVIFRMPNLMPPTVPSYCAYCYWRSKQGEGP